MNLIKKMEWTIDYLTLHQRWRLPLEIIQVRMTVIHGVSHSAAVAKQYAAKLVLHILLIGAGTLLMSLINGVPMLIAGSLLNLLYIWYSFKSLDNQVKRRKQMIIIKLPELLSKLTLLIHAGETTQQAIHRCVNVTDEQTHPLDKEWAKLSRALINNSPFVIAIEEFNRACGVLEVSMFSTTVLMNFRRGGSDFAAALHELSHTLWERRKAMAKTIGEEASAKLVFPMVLLFSTVMIIVAVPAFLAMN